MAITHKQVTKERPNYTTEIDGRYMEFKFFFSLPVSVIQENDIQDIKGQIVLLREAALDKDAFDTLVREGLQIELFADLADDYFNFCNEIKNNDK